ncbi:hypothetical protein JMN32_14835 [Fulvivirga sp. 29W222]|uniref:Uncharacterized protein n=1 Tax=Fulvivirga marina TaxID=2494733 RepID=A0A937FYZ0_9BACT|nr:hypothetical protein [Fulvivirga marina]MBL6447592.1 hypothetical protein [Fulvivirga marina]
MDQETLTNHIVKLGKHQFNVACQLIFNNVFNFHAINVDGKNDGGTDFIGIDKEGKRRKVAYQLTTQKTDIKRKAYRDSKKALDKLGVESFYYVPTYNLDEIESRKLEADITNELGITASVFNPTVLAGFIINENLLNSFLDKLNYPLPRDHKLKGPDFRERALHSYSMFSKDSKDLKQGIYDDTILFILSEKSPLSEDDLESEALKFLGIDNAVENGLIKKRIGGLFGNEKLKWNDQKQIVLADNANNDVISRKRIYEAELNTLTSAQTDLLRDEYQIEWTFEDSKKVSVWIAEAFISDRISNLEDLKISLVAHPLYKVGGDSTNKIRSYLINNGVQKKDVEKAIVSLLEIATGHPLINKITRASMYLALEGADPISKSKALGANRWNEFDVMIEPSVAIPFICSQLYSGYVNRFFNLSVKAINRINEIGAKACIPYFYINECAGHLLRARKYMYFDIDEKELQFSSNAFIANYYGLKSQGKKVPNTLIEYLSTFSPAIKSERKNVKDWIRSLMTDLQTTLNNSGVDFVHVPTFSADDCVDFEKEYMFQLDDHKLEKPKHLIQHDIWALKHTNDQIINSNQHWIVLTYDKSLISFSKAEIYNGHVTTPAKFIDITESTKPLSETHFVSLLHSVATFSERTLSAGARVMDRIARYASDDVQNWEFKEEIKEFKSEIIESLDLDSIEIYDEIDKKTDEFLKKHGVKLQIDESEEIDL